MFEKWKVLHVDENEDENKLFCRALEQLEFAGKCESVRSFRGAKSYLQRCLFNPVLNSRPDMIIINWHSNCDQRVLEFVRWVRLQPQMKYTPMAVFITDRLSSLAQQQAQKAGVTEMVIRPATYDALFAELKGLLERSVERCVARYQDDE